jgi:ABC-2 type transport system ATP-binding protein
MADAAILIEGFTKKYGSRTAVEELTMEVPRGSVYGLLGQNGAGKSTIIRTLLNLLQPTSGRLSILGLDSVAGSLDVRRRVGYLPESPDYYGWMTVDEIVAFNAAFYDSWDAGYAADLLKRLELPLDRRLRELSRGMQAKVGLVMALGSRPELLILDDPTSGLDALVRREFLETVISDVQSEGGTVLFSTHLIHEMERVADEVAILHEGRLLLRSSIEDIKRTTKRLRIVYPAALPRELRVAGMIRAELNAHHAVVTVSGFHEGLPGEIVASGAESVEVIDLSLEEIFVESVQGGRADG